MIVGELLIRIKAEADAFRTELNNAKNDVNGFAKMINNHKAELTAFGTASLAIGGGLTALAGTMGLTAARTQVLGTVLKVVSTSAGYLPAEIEKVESTIKKLGITTQESRLAIVRFIQSQLDIEQAAKLARAAQDLAVIANENSSQTFQTLTEAIISQHPMLLRQYGIVLTLDQVYEKYAATLKKDVAALTETEKKQAFLNVIMEASKKVAGSYEAAMNDVGKQLTSMPRYLEEAANELGKFFLPVMLSVVIAVRDFLSWITKLPESVKFVIAAMVGLGGIFLTVAGAIALGFANATKLTLAFNGLRTSALALNAVMAANPFLAAATAITLLGTGLTLLANAYLDVKNKMMQTGNATNERIKLLQEENKLYMMQKKNLMDDLMYKVNHGIASAEVQAKYARDKAEIDAQIQRRDVAIAAQQKILDKEIADAKKARQGEITTATKAEVLKRQEADKGEAYNRVLTGEMTLQSYKDILIKQQQELVKYGNAAKKEYNDLGNEIISVNTKIANSTRETDRQTAQEKMQMHQMSKIEYRNLLMTQLNSLKNHGESEKLEYERIKKEITKINIELADEIRNTWNELGTDFVSAFSTAFAQNAQELQNFSSFVDKVVDNIKNMIINQLGQFLFTGILSLIAAPFTGGIGAAFSALGGGGVFGKLIFPKMADGGIAMSPQIVQVAENRVPEAIIPLDKLGDIMSGQKMSGSTTKNITLSVKIEDNRLSGNPYKEKEMTTIIGNAMKKYGVKI